MRPFLGRTAPLAAAALSVAPLTLAGPVPASTAFAATESTDGTYLLGAGMYDITGAVAETGMFGYAAQQEVTGLQQRLYSRAFVIADPGTGKRVVLVTADLGAVFPSVKSGVVRRLAAKFGDRYPDAAVLISATHSHVATSGLSYDKLYQIAGADGRGYGFDQKNLDTVIDGIVESIARADANLRPGTLEHAAGDLTGATRNRSLPAFRADADASAYPDAVDPRMTQLEFRATDGSPLGVLNWFAQHPTSFSNKWTQISGDNKGYAEYGFEKKMGGDPADPKGFVAAFANSAMGDVVSTQGNAYSVPGFQGSTNEFVNAETDGRRQLDRALQLWNGPGEKISGQVDYRARYVDLAGYTVGAAHTGGQGPQKLCTPARGFSFAAGGENGPSNIPGIYEGMTKGTFRVDDAVNKVDQSALGGLVRATFGGLAVAWQDPCQAEKPVLLPTGAWGWTSRVVPMQLIRVGELAIIAVPGEPTTVAAHRIRETVARELAASGVKYVVVASAANDYHGYITTREEYATQQYEGASTEFGPYELGALQQESARLATAMAGGTPVTSDRGPDLPSQAATLQRPGVAFDDKPVDQEFGQVLTQPAASYQRGSTASATFRGAHPKNDYRTMGTFLRVERLVDGRWTTWLTDRDWDTSYTWKREGVSWSRTAVDWRIAADTPAGTYRLVQTGDWKNGWNGKISPYTGTSTPFTVE